MTNVKESSITWIYAYHKGNWVLVPLLHMPKEAIDEDGKIHQHQLILLEEQSPTISRPKRNSEPAFEKISLSVKGRIDPEKLSDAEIKSLCTKNNIPLSWVTNRFKKDFERTKTQGHNRRTKRKCAILNGRGYTKFIKELNRISKQSTLIAKILWFLNKRLAKCFDYITLEELLRLQIGDVDPDDGLGTCISLSRSNLSRSHLVGHFLPKHIWKALCKQIRADHLYVFSNKNGGPILPDTVNREFKEAGKAAGFKKPITSLSLRPMSPSNKSKKQPICIRGHSNEKLKEISVTEWRSLCQAVPALIKKQGRPSKYDQRIIFNAILYYLRNETSLRKLPSTFPPAKAIHSQYRRWRDSGVFEEVLIAR